jgi:peptidoglycan hydrolase-like amidase
MLKQIDSIGAKEFTLLKSQENIITTIASSSKNISNTITKSFAESDVKIIKFIKTISKNFTSSSINDSRWNNLSLLTKFPLE